jgi:hypothetical protein
MKHRKISLKCPTCLKTRSVDKYCSGKLCFKCNLEELKHKRIGKYKDITGQTFGKLKVVSVAYKVNTKYCWNCICECGKAAIIEGNRLRSGKTKSCGCLRKTQNGLSQSSIYNVWISMIHRCCNENSTGYKNYGARGISVCKRWINSFEAFYEDMGNKPDGLTLDRIDVNGNYNKDNCRWATTKVQSNNRRNTVFIEAFGKKQLILEWSKEKNIKEATLRARLKYGWSPEKILTRKVTKWQKQKLSR